MSNTVYQLADNHEYIAKIQDFHKERLELLNIQSAEGEHEVYGGKRVLGFVAGSGGSLEAVSMKEGDQPDGWYISARMRNHTYHDMGSKIEFYTPKGPSKEAKAVRKRWREYRTLDLEDFTQLFGVNSMHFMRPNTGGPGLVMGRMNYAIVPAKEREEEVDGYYLIVPTRTGEPWIPEGDCRELLNSEWEYLKTKHDL